MPKDSPAAKHTITAARTAPRTTAREITAARFRDAFVQPSAVEECKRLIAAGADVNVVNRNGKGPVHFAAQWCSNTEVMALLLENGADVNAATHRGHTPLIYAAGRQRVETIEFLLSHGADAATWTVQGVCVVSMSKSQGLPSELITRLEASQRASSNPREFKDDPRAQSVQQEWRRLNSSRLRRQEASRSARNPPAMDPEVIKLAFNLGRAASESTTTLSAALLAAAASNSDDNGAPILQRALEFCIAGGASHDDCASVVDTGSGGHVALRRRGDVEEEESLRQAQATIARTHLQWHSTTGRRLGLRALPYAGDMCHYDREYTFVSLGGFDQLTPRPVFLMASNDDRRTSRAQLMWKIALKRLPLGQPSGSGAHVRRVVRVFVNFRSEAHVVNGGAAEWLDRDGWRRREEIEPTSSSGVPNGPYTGPVYSMEVDTAVDGGDADDDSDRTSVALYGSDTWEGVYFVFVQLLTDQPAQEQGVIGRQSAPWQEYEERVATADVGEGEGEEEGDVEEEGEDEKEVELESPEAEAPPQAVSGVTEQTTDRRTATAEELLRAARAETLGRCLSESLARSSDTGARKRSRNTLRIVAAAVTAVVHNDTVIGSLVQSGVALSDLCEVRTALMRLSSHPHVI